MLAPSSALLAAVALLAASLAEARPASLPLHRSARLARRQQSSIATRPLSADPRTPRGDVPADYVPVFDADAALIKAVSSSANQPFLISPNVLPNSKNGKTRTVPSAPATARSCFPGLGQAPSIPTAAATASSLQSWWCDQSTEYAFMGFSYDLSACPSLSQLNTDFGLMRKQYNARYVRLYGACDATTTMYTNIVSATASQGLGVYALVWFGFDGDDQWKSRLSDLINVVKRVPAAPYVIRSIAIGSEPLFDGVLSVGDMVTQIKSAKSQLAAYGMQITISEMPYGFQMNGGAPSIFSEIDSLSANVLPFFDSAATTGDKAWSTVAWSMDYMRQQGGTTKPLRLTQTGWPSNDSVWKANSAKAVASVASEKAYFDLLDSHCGDFKKLSAGWFAHIWNDDTLPGWGIVDGGNKPKFAFKPRTTC